MRNLKRVLTLVMAVAMMMSLLVVGASAKFTDQDKIENTDAVNMNVALGIIKGRDTGEFDPTGNVTRTEMAKMIAVALNGGKEPSLGTKATPTFKDIKGHWGEAYIEYCAALGIVAGMGDGTFNPNGNVTGTQAAKMMLVALGYDAANEGFNGATWAVKINVVASHNDLYKGLAIDPNASLNRDNAAQLIWNGLNAKMVKYEYSLTSVNGQLQNIKVPAEYNDKRTLLSNKYSQYDFAGTLAQFSYNSAKNEWTYTIKVVGGGTAQQIGGTGSAVSSTSFTSNVDYTAYYGQNVKVVYSYENNKVAKVFGMFAEDSQVLFSGILDDISIKTDSLKFDGKVYDMDNTTSAATAVYKYTYNKDIVTSVTAGTDLWYVASTNGIATMANSRYNDPWSWSFKAIDKDGDNKVDFLLVYPFTVEDVTYVGAKTITAGTNSYTIADCTVDNGIKKGDYTKVIARANTATNTTELKAVDKVLNGKVTAFTSATKVATVDGAKYTVAAGCPQTVDVNTVLKDAAVVNGFIFDADVTGTVSVDDYAVLVNAVSGSGSLNGTQAKILLPNGTNKVVDTATSYAGSGLIGKLVKLSTNSDGDYSFVAAPTPADGSGTGFTTAVTGGLVTNVDGVVSGKVRYLNNWDVADEAVIFVEKPGSTYEVITGAKLKSLACTTLTLNKAFANKSSATGFTQVMMAYVTSSASLTTVDQQYGYAIANADTTSVDGKKVYSLKLWDGTKEVTVVTKDTTGLSAAGSVAKGDLVIYTLDSNDKLATISANNVATRGVAITALNSTFLQLNGLGQRYELTKDTKYIYVDHANKTGIEGGSLNLAGKRADGSFIANAAVIFDATSFEVEAVIFDTKNDISGESKAVFASAPADATLAAALSNYSEVYVSGNFTAAAAVTVPTGKTLTVTGNFDANGQTVSVNGTGKLIVNGDAVIDAAATVNGTMTVTGTLADDAAITGTGTLTIAGVVDNDYDNVRVANVVVTANVTNATTLYVGACNYTFKGLVTGVLTLDAGSKVTFEKTLATNKIVGAVGAEVTFKVAPTLSVTTDILDCFKNATTLISDPANITLNVAYVYTSNAAATGTANCWVK